jgi:dihydropteroate synthase
MPAHVNASGSRAVVDDAVKIMGVLNVTPDSFSDGGQFTSVDAALRHVDKMLHEGADIIDIGGYSSRPGAEDIDVETELQRLEPVVRAVRRRFPSATLSIDTFRSHVAAEMLDLGANMINDISAGSDPRMLPLVVSHRASYIAMHMQGTPKTMQLAPSYVDVVGDIHSFLKERVALARVAGVGDIWIDPGFGFGKTIDDNYALLANLHKFADIGAPLVVGLSRKSMFWRLFGVGPSDVIPAASAAHLWSLGQGAMMLRVHDVAAAKQVVRVAAQINKPTGRPLA